MKTIRKPLALLLALATALALAACGSAPQETAPQRHGAADPGATASAPPTTAVEPTAEPTPEPTPAPTPEPESTSTPKPEYPTMEDLQAMYGSGYVHTESTQTVALVLPGESQLLQTPVRAQILPALESIYVLPVPIRGEGYGNLGTMSGGSRVWIMAQTESFYFFTADGTVMGWARKDFFCSPDGSALAIPADRPAEPDMAPTVEIFRTNVAPTLENLEDLVASGAVKTTSDKNEELELPLDLMMLSKPFRAIVTSTPTGIYVMPMPEAGHGQLGSVEVGSVVWVVAQYRGFYFFVFENRKMGWNGAAYFQAP